MSQCQCIDVHTCEICDPGLSIAPGLKNLPRQIADFAQFRRRMLTQVLEQDALSDWRPCGQQDFGLMLLEMWAYVADVQSFYDEVIAQESYLRTAKRRPSLRKLVDLLGYVPRPAVAASANLAVLGEGRQPLTLPVGLAFRSTAFDKEAPQVFELDQDSTIHPLHNLWQLAPIQQTTLSNSGTAMAKSFATILVETDTSLKAQDIVLVRVAGGSSTYKQVRTVSAIEDYSDKLGNKYKQISFNQVLNLRGDFSPSAVKISRATQAGGLWTQAHISGDPEAIDNTRVVLDGLYRRIKAGQHIVIERSGVYKWFKVTAVADVSMTLSAATTDTVQDSEGTDIAIAIPAVKAPATRLTLNKQVEVGNWNTSHTDKMTLHYGFDKAGKMVLEPSTSIEVDSGAGSSTNLSLEEPVETPFNAPEISQVLLKDKNEQGAKAGATIDYDAPQLELDQNTELPELTLPVKAYGNVVAVSRGESVVNEILGSGDATLASQFFSLKKKPLTYLNVAGGDNEQGVVSTLTVYVDGVAWREVNNFYGVGADEQVYYVRQDDEQNTRVHFGDGRNGARLTTGAGNVAVNYRFGAGKAAPPAGAINQLAKPVKGLKGVLNTLGATGGDDAEAAADIRELAPRSALLLGRAVSIEDMQVVAAGVAGVEFAHAEWRWQETKQRPGVQVWYLGDADNKALVHEKLRNLTDINTPIAVDTVIPVPLGLSLDIEIDSRYQQEQVLSQVYQQLLDEKEGLLQSANMGFAQPLFRSAVFARLLSVPGTISVRGIVLHFYYWEIPWTFTALKPPVGFAWDFKQGGVMINGKSYV